MTRQALFQEIRYINKTIPLQAKHIAMGNIFTDGSATITPKLNIWLIKAKKWFPKETLRKESFLTSG